MVEEKLTLKHIAPYLPYGLKCLCLNKTIHRIELVNKVFVLDSYIEHDKWKYWTHDKSFVSQINCLGKGFKVNEFKPILRPLSDLTKEITVNGETFVPIEKMGFENNEENLESMLFVIGKLHVPYSEIERLFEWHFDVFGLIEKGLAIDINTIK